MSREDPKSPLSRQAPQSTQSPLSRQAPPSTQSPQAPPPPRPPRAVERRADREEVADRYLRDVFRERARALTSLAAARALAADVPSPPDHPGTRYHTNLGEFLARFEAPASSHLAERIVFIAIARMLAERGELEDGLLATIEERFRRARPPLR